MTFFSIISVVIFINRIFGTSFSVTRRGTKTQAYDFLLETKVRTFVHWLVRWAVSNVLSNLQQRRCRRKVFWRRREIRCKVSNEHFADDVFIVCVKLFLKEIFQNVVANWIANRKNLSVSNVISSCCSWKLENNATAKSRHKRIQVCKLRKQNNSCDSLFPLACHHQYVLSHFKAYKLQVLWYLKRKVWKCSWYCN